MNADRELHEAYREWHRLAEAEGEAIQSCNWSLLAACQKALQHLQERTTNLTAAAKLEWQKLGPASAAREKKFNAVIRELIHLEQRNNALLAAVRENARQRLEQLDQAGRNLKRIEASYTGHAPATWTSFS